MMPKPLVRVCLTPFGHLHSAIDPLSALSETALSQFDYRKMVTAYYDNKNNTVASVASQKV